MNCKTITYYPATSSTEAILRFRDGECVQVITPSDIIIDSLSNNCFKGILDLIENISIMRNQILKVLKTNSLGLGV